MKHISLFKKLDSSRFDELGFQLKSTYLYKDEMNGLTILSSEAKEHDEIFVSSKDDEWVIEQYGLIIDYSFHIGRCKTLFEKGEGVAMNDSALSVYIIHTNPENRFRKSDKVYTIYENSKDIDVTKSIIIPANSIEEYLNVEVVLVLEKKSSKPCLPQFVEVDGSILGTIKEYKLSFRGQGSLFPIVEISKPDSPLWNIEFDYDDPDTSQFVDCVKLVINKDHKDYRYLDVKDESSFCSRLLIEIMQSSILQLLLHMLDEKQLNGFDLATHGSIKQFVNYLIEVKDLDISTAKSISDSLKNYLDKHEGEI